MTQSASMLPPFFMSSVPKSGTHLLHQLLTGMPNVVHEMNQTRNKFFMTTQKPEYYRDHFYRLAQLKPNEFGLGHVYYTPEYAWMLSRLNLKHVFIHRDPRDMLVSLSYYIPRGWPDHVFYDDFKHITNTKQRLLMLLTGGGKMATFEEWVRPWYMWKKHPGTFTVSYEELIVSPQSRYNAALRICQFLWSGLNPPIPLPQMAQRMVDNIQPGKAFTFRQGGTGAWKQEFDEEVKDAFKQLAGRLLSDFGYETNPNW